MCYAGHDDPTIFHLISYILVLLFFCAYKKIGVSPILFSSCQNQQYIGDEKAQTFITGDVYHSILCCFRILFVLVV